MSNESKFKLGDKVFSGLTDGCFRLNKEPYEIIQVVGSTQLDDRGITHSKPFTYYQYEVCSKLGSCSMKLISESSLFKTYEEAKAQVLAYLGLNND